VAQVRQGFHAALVPRSVLTANWFRTTNQGDKVIVQTSSEFQSKPAELSVRCASLDTSQCLDFDASKGQVSPNTATIDALTATQTVTDAALDSFRRQAKADATWYAGCPPSSPGNSGLTGKVVFVEDMTGCGSYNDGGNTEAAPGFLVIAKGALTLGGNGIFYGVIYAANRSGIAYPNPVISLQGTAGIYGSVTIDGQGASSPAPPRSISCSIPAASDSSRSTRVPASSRTRGDPCLSANEGSANEHWCRSGHRVANTL
jgi:hypothetical protein